MSPFPVRIFSGIQPTGTLHLGNYFGAVQRWANSLKALPDSDSSRYQENIFSIVDLHALTLPQNPKVEQVSTLSSLFYLVQILHFSQTSRQTRKKTLKNCACRTRYSFV